jgi:UPF0755 protein
VSRGARAGLWALVLALAVAGGGAAWAWHQLQPPAPRESGGAGRVDVQIPRGADMGRIAELLEKKGMIRDATVFRWFARFQGKAAHVQAGRYDLPRDRTGPELLDLLVEGRTRLARIVVPEGLTAEDAAAAVARQAPFSAAEYLALARDSVLADSLGVPGPALEGYLFPETYFVDPDISAREFVKLQVQTFREVFDDDIARAPEAQDLSPREIVTLASIVEAEARRADERPVIASVYRNRLRRGMPLEADPTIQYALGGHRDRILYRDLEVDSPYNTYRNPGLPPGPICSPGLASLKAAVQPDSTPYLYFFWIGDSLGTHTFSETYGEHLRKRAQLGR